MQRWNLREIATPDRIPEYIARAKNKDDPFRLMGFGHRVYKSYDPRAKIIKKTAEEVFAVTGKNPLLDIALKIRGAPRAARVVNAHGREQLPSAMPRHRRRRRSAMPLPK